jgi:hypothetical protein
MTKKKKETRGRKPVQDKVVSMTICVRQSQIDAHGGIEKAREVAKQAFLNYTDID